jgi:hypothetical protein
MKNYLAETSFIDYSNTKIKEISNTLYSPNASDTDNAIALYLYVRDAIKYDPALRPAKYLKRVKDIVFQRPFF